MNFIIVILTLLWLFFLARLVFPWISLIRHSVQCFFSERHPYQKRHREFCRHYAPQGQSYSLREWDSILLNAWAEEEPIPTHCPESFTPQAFVNWIKLFPLRKIFLPSSEGHCVPTLERTAGDSKDPCYGFLHGIWDSSMGFFPVAYYLWRLHQGRVCFIFQEMPGHGAYNTTSESLTLSFTYPQLAELIGLRLSGKAQDENGKTISAVSAVTLFGNSMGGAVCLIALARFPQYIQSAIPINPAIVPQKELPSIFRLTRWSTPSLMRLFLAYFLADVGLKQISSSHLHALPDKPMGLSRFQHWHRYAYIHHPLFPFVALKVAKDLLAMHGDSVLFQKILSELQTIPTGKIFLINGQDDIWLDIEAMPKIITQQWKMSIRYLLLKNAGHCAHCDQPEKIAKAVFQWQNTSL